MEPSSTLNSVALGITLSAAAVAILAFLAGRLLVSGSRKKADKFVVTFRAGGRESVLKWDFDPKDVHSIHELARAYEEVLANSPAAGTEQREAAGGR